MILVHKEIKDRIDNYKKYKDVYSDRKPKPIIENFIEENL